MASARCSSCTRRCGAATPASRSSSTARRRTPSSSPVPCTPPSARPPATGRSSRPDVGASSPARAVAHARRRLAKGARRRAKALRGGKKKLRHGLKQVRRGARRARAAGARTWQGRYRPTYGRTAARVPVRAELPHLLNARGLAGRGAEIGVMKGNFSATLLRDWHGRELLSIDPWLEVPENEGHARAVLAQFGARSRILVMTSEAAAAQVPDASLDFAYVDARHDYASVKADLAAWYPKIRPGGILGTTTRSRASERRSTSSRPRTASPSTPPAASRPRAGDRAAGARTRRGSSRCRRAAEHAAEPGRGEATLLRRIHARPLPAHPHRPVPELRVDAPAPGRARPRGAGRRGLGPLSLRRLRCAARRTADRDAHGHAARARGPLERARPRRAGGERLPALSGAALRGRDEAARPRAAPGPAVAALGGRPPRGPGARRPPAATDRARPAAEPGRRRVRAGRAARPGVPHAALRLPRPARGAPRRAVARRADLPHRRELGQPEQQGPDPRAPRRPGGVERGAAARGVGAAGHRRRPGRGHGRAELRRVVRARAVEHRGGVHGAARARPAASLPALPRLVVVHRARRGAVRRRVAARAAHRGRPPAARHRRAVPAAPAERAPVGP